MTALTPGQQALQEAARLEQARIYGRTLTQVATEAAAGEHRPADHHAEPRRPVGRELDAAVWYWRREGQSVASIAFRLGCTRGTVRAAIDRLGLAS